MACNELRVAAEGILEPAQAPDLMAQIPHHREIMAEVELHAGGSRD
jgi:hypothetical protein